MRLYGDKRRLAREEIFNALRRLGGWHTACEVHREYYAQWTDTRVGGWIWAVPAGMPRPDHQQVYALLNDLHDAEMVDRRQINSRVVRWHAPPPVPFEDTFPEEWSKELVTV